MIKGILFDFNGTMFFDGPMHKKAWNTFSLKSVSYTHLDVYKRQDHNGISERSVGMMKNTVVPVWEKYMLTIEEASKYFGRCV